MSDPAPLTDEELAAYQSESERWGGLGEEKSLRLIADLRAARAEVERLRSDLAAVRLAYAVVSATLTGVVRP